MLIVEINKVGHDDDSDDSVNSNSEERRRTTHPHQVQCLYPESQVGGAMSGNTLPTGEIN